MMPDTLLDKKLLVKKVFLKNPFIMPNWIVSTMALLSVSLELSISHQSTLFISQPLNHAEMETPFKVLEYF